MSREKIFEIQAGLCRAMGNPVRMEIVHLLRNEEMRVSDIAFAMHLPQGTISRNLGALRNAGRNERWNGYLN
jgi:DNA-binding transcriptional ArsR family regulator